jgi:Family of unknown function (DUF6262)
MRADNSRHVVEAARRRGQLTRSKAVQALRAMDAAGEPITFETVAQRAQVSKSWPYAQPDLRAEIENLRATHRQAPDSRIPARQRSSDASLRQRLEAANARLRQLAEENRTLREQLARALGEQRSATSPRPPRTGPNSSRSVTIGPC